MGVVWFSLNAATGEVVFRSDAAPGVALGRRIAVLLTALPPQRPGDHGQATWACDGCGASAIADFTAPALPAGWISRGDGDFCPQCKDERI